MTANGKYFCETYFLKSIIYYIIKCKGGDTNVFNSSVLSIRQVMSILLYILFTIHL